MKFVTKVLLFFSDGEMTFTEFVFVVVLLIVAMVGGMLLLGFTYGPHHSVDSPKYRDYGNHQTHSLKDK